MSMYSFSVRCSKHAWEGDNVCGRGEAASPAEGSGILSMGGKHTRPWRATASGGGGGLGKSWVQLHSHCDKIHQVEEQPILYKQVSCAARYTSGSPVSSVGRRQWAL